MDAGNLISLIIGAGEKVKSVAGDYLYKPFTDDTVQLLMYDVDRELYTVNCKLREELGIEIYLDVKVLISDVSLTGALKVRKLGDISGKVDFSVSVSKSTLNKALKCD